MSDKTAPETAKNPAPPGPQTDVNLLAKMLTAVGGGAVSQGLALDLVLNEVVEQACKATRATGAAIALLRDGQMICRASTGNAPDLGVRVETESGISGTCLITGNVQLCSDTDVDPRVNAEACRLLDVRSMLMAPISDATETFGIVEVFAAEANSFTEDDVTTLENLAQRIADAKKASEESLEPEPVPEQNAEILAQSPVLASKSEQPRESEVPPHVVAEDAGRYDTLTSFLVVLVIAAAILLGVVIGAGVVHKRISAAPSARGAAGSIVTSNRAPETGNTPATESSSPNSAPPTNAAPPVPIEPPVGGLIVTQNGKIVYRSGPPASVARTSGGEKSPSRLVHRVDPQYPEAARTQHVEGSVVLNAHVMGDGSVSEVEVVSGPPLLADAATRAVKQWKYQPYSVNGQSVERQERITVKFTLPST